MATTHVLSGLHCRRAHLAGEIEAAQAALAKQRERLATLDAVIRMFEPGGDPELIPSIRPRGRRSPWFRHGEQTRLCLSALREADGPVPARQVAEYAIRVKGLDVDGHTKAQVVESMRNTLARLGAKGLTRKVIRWPDAWWELAV
jgi:hypothetical protein